MNQRILGVDPGTQKTGIGIVEKKGNQLIPIFFETLKLKTTLSRAEKLQVIYQHVSKVIKEFSVEAVSLEDVFFSRNFKSALRIGEARAAVMIAGVANNIAVHEYLPTKVKGSVCGNGRASKQQIQYMVTRLLSLKEIPEEDASDALAVAICHLHASKVANQYV